MSDSPASRKPRQRSADTARQTQSSLSGKAGAGKPGPGKTGVAKKAGRPARRMTREGAAQFYARLADVAPAPDTELNYKDPYTLLVAVTLSAQATDIGVNRATGPLFKVADTPAKMVALGRERLGEYIRTIGLWRNKAKNVIALSEILLADYDGVVPQTRDALEALPGVGRKTANVVCNVAFGQPTIAVDTHIFRVGNRTGLAPGKTPLAVELALEKITPEAYLQHAHHWLILHGRYVCKARTPDCPACAVSDLCGYRDKTGMADSEKKKPSKKAVAGTVKKSPQPAKSKPIPKTKTARKNVVS